VKLRILAPVLLLCALALFLAGVFAAKREMPPLPQLAALLRSPSSDSDSPVPVNDTARIFIPADDIRRIISFDSGREALERREILRRAIGIHALMPQVSVGKGLRYARSDLIESHQLLRFEMRHGLVSNVHYLEPANFNRRIFILHAGHSAWPEEFGGDKLITALLEKGFGVALFSMPLAGYNLEKVSVQTERFGKIDLINHNAFFFTEEEAFSPISYFIDPVLAFVRHAREQGYADEFAMGGHSGGGWTTVIAAALEPHIAKSYVVAGTSPEFLTPHVTPSGWGDYEQTNMRMLRAANYLEMYALAALETKRRQVYIFARKDPCCWNGPNLGIYERSVQRHLVKLGGGSFAVAIDEKSEAHSYSDFAREYILADLTGR
jgi:pimeloyl-ACP methyl ester carboxylesterase